MHAQFGQALMGSEWGEDEAASTCPFLLSPDITIGGKSRGPHTHYCWPNLPIFCGTSLRNFFFTLKWHHYYHHYWTVLGRFLFIVINVPNTWSVSSQSVGKTILLALEMSSYIYGQLRGVVSLANLGGLPHEVRGSRHLVLHASHFMNCWLFNIWRCWIHQSKSCKK